MTTHGCHYKKGFIVVSWKKFINILACALLAIWSGFVDTRMTGKDAASDIETCCDYELLIANIFWFGLKFDILARVGFLRHFKKHEHH